MNNTKWPLALLLLFLLICTCFFSNTRARPSGVKLQSQYFRAITAYRRLERSLPPQELRALTGLGLINGARQAEEQMEQHLVQAVKELLVQTESMQSNQVLPKVDEIEQQLERDQRALNILSSAMDLLSNIKNEEQFREDLRDVLYKQQQQQFEQQTEENPQLGERLGQLRLHILQKVPEMKSHLDNKIEQALESILKQATPDGPLAKASQKVLRKRATNKEDLAEKQKPEPVEMHVIKSILSEAILLNMQDDFRKNLVVQQFEKSDENNKDSELKAEIDEINLDSDSQNVTDKSKTTPNGKQEDGDGFSELDEDGDNNSGGGGGGGLVGIIGSLSGGEGGSDVGALIGALTGLISTLFGPGGLDIEALISTATSLLSGLLSGNKNFGTVLGQYVGTAFDGLSGGGGAINNGLFLGNFVGTVLAALSADPEEEGPPQPLTFTKNFLGAFIESKFRPNSDEASEERHGTADLPHEKKKKSGASGGGFDSGGFVKQIASHLVSSALGLLLNASLGASGGASHASTGLFSSSSHHMKPVTGRSWTQL